MSLFACMGCKAGGAILAMRFSVPIHLQNDKPDNHNFQSGFSVLYQKILKGKLMCKEVSDLFKARWYF